MTEQDATESVAIYKDIIEQQKLEMTKFADFVKGQTENMKSLQEKHAHQAALIDKYDAELAQERGRRQYIVDNMSMTEQARVQLSQKCVKQEKEIKQLNRMYLQVAAEKTELNRAKTIAENKLQRKREAHEELQKQHQVVLQQIVQQSKINHYIQNVLAMVQKQEGYEKL